MNAQRLAIYRRQLCTLLLLLLGLVGQAGAEPTSLMSTTDWDARTWSGQGNFEMNGDGEQQSLVIVSSDGGDLSWSREVAVEPNGLYRLTGEIQTKGLNPGSGSGALLNVHGISSARTQAVTGDSAWTAVSVVFRVGDRSQIMVNCLFGGWGESTGTARYRNVALQQIDLESLSPNVVIHADQPTAPMSELIYGQFIEHMGRCIYGGIWAEMLEDRKFYYPVTAEYNPYANDAMFPPIARSPWEMLGGAGKVKMVTEAPFVGDHTPRIAAGGGIRQHDLGVVEGKRYTGYIWLKAAAGSPRVTIALSPASEPVIVEAAAGEYIKHEFAFTANASTDKAQLTVSVTGGDVLVGTLSLMPADHVEGMRADTLSLLKKLKSPIYRWPGGNFVSGYDWRDGIGDRDRRPPRTNPAWTGVEHNDFGMHEFIRLCELLETEPLITINMGFEGAFSAEAEFEYANGPIDTYWGGKRAAHGRAEPFDVKYWCIGNEMWGNWQLGFMSAEDYQIKHNWVVDRLRKNHPDFLAIGSGDAGNWSRGLLEHCAHNMDLIAEHFYIFEPSEDVTEHVNKFTAAIRSKADFHRQAQRELGLLDNRPVPIAMTEWNYWYGPHPYGELGTIYYLKDALGIAAGLNEYARCSDIIGAAFYAQTVNVIGCIKTTKTEAFLATTALPLIMYREHFGTRPVTVDAEEAGLLGLDVAAAWTEDGKTLTVAVVNTRLEQIQLDLEVLGAELSGTVEAYRFGGNDPMLHNTPDRPDALGVERVDVATLEQPQTLPGYSVTIFRVSN